MCHAPVQGWLRADAGSAELQAPHPGSVTGPRGRGVGEVGFSVDGWGWGLGVGEDLMGGAGFRSG